MPTYEFRCPDGTIVERVYKISEVPEAIPSPNGDGMAVRVISGGAGLIFKGSGFYITDYGKDGKKDQRTTSGGDAKGSDAKGGDAKGGDAKGSVAKGSVAKGGESGAAGGGSTGSGPAATSTSGGAAGGASGSSSGGSASGSTPAAS
jgi:predicted nucleic acid-binding Zn ribbon protein